MSVLKSTNKAQCWCVQYYIIINMNGINWPICKYECKVSVCLSICLSVCLSVCLTVCLSVGWLDGLSVGLSIPANRNTISQVMKYQYALISRFNLNFSELRQE